MINREVIESFTDDCKPHVLVVTDMWFSKDDAEFRGFSLARFIETLVEGEVLGVKAKVTKASLLPEGLDPEADIPGFTFDKLLRSEYDVCFIFTFEPVIDPRRRGIAGRITGSPLPLLQPDELTAIKKFMEEGGGVFSTGDHEDLGARTAKDIPRVSSMRKWTREQGAPSADGTDRLSTNLPGDDELYEFNDQSDRHLQRLYLNRRTKAGGTVKIGDVDTHIDMPHP
ncbi:MAG: hypothetical protein D3914_12780, partial [Candidatus Electrothrix sp. LOE2]|nr:hypothetical protein [Candidatus Electrothrix sp. LOE2]